MEKLLYKWESTFGCSKTALNFREDWWRPNGHVIEKHNWKDNVLKAFQDQNYVNYLEESITDPTELDMCTTGFENRKGQLIWSHCTL